MQRLFDVNQVVHVVNSAVQCICSMVCLTAQYKYTLMCQSNTKNLYYVFYCISATCFDSYRITFRPF